MNESSNPMKSGLGAIERYLPETAPVSETAPTPVLVSIASLRGLFWRQKTVLLGVTAAAVLVGLVVTLLATPLYHATATLRVSTDAGQIVEGQDLLEPYIHPNQVNNYMTTLGQVIESRSMALRVADKIDIPEIETTVNGDGAQAAEARRQAEADALQAGVEVDVPFDSQIISVHYTSTSPAAAARIANAYVESFLADSVERSVEANSYARAYLEGQIADVRIELRDAEMRAIAYARSNRLLGQPIGGDAAPDGSSAGTPQTLGASSLASISQSYSSARANRIVAEERWRAVAAIPAAQLPEVQQNSNVQAMRTELARQQSRLADLRERYLDDYPDVKEARAEIVALQQQIASAGADIKNGVRRAYEVAKRQEQGLQVEVERVSDASLQEQDRRVQYNLIDRDVSSLRSQLAALLERYNQIASAANLRSSNVTPLDAATPPTAPISPNLWKNLLVALVLGAGLAAVIAILRELLDDRLRSSDEVEAKLGVPALGQTPFVVNDLREELADSFSPVSEAYSSIRATLDYVMRAHDQQVIQFTSSSESEGKTTTCVAVARKYASVGKRVLLLDMDLRRPAVHRHFSGKRSEAGIVDVIFSRVKLADALLDSGVTNLDVLPVGEIPPNPVETLSSGLVAEFLNRVRRDYDVVLVDSSPVMGIADAPLLARFVDGVVFVVEANGMHSRAARAAIRRLLDMKAQIVGVVVTKYRALEAGQNKAYQYRHYSYNANGA